MHESSDFTGFLRNVFPGAGEALLRLYAGAADEAGLLSTDFYTIRDLLELSGHTDETLQALLVCLFVALEEGSLCVECSQAGLSRRLADLASDTEADDWAGRIVADLSANRFPRLLGSPAEDRKPVILAPRRGKAYAYFQRLWRAEQTAQHELRKRLTPSGSLSDTTRYPQVLREVLQERPLRMDDRVVRLGRDQRLALGLALLRDFVIVSGGPGTGKTSIVVTLLRCLLHLGFPGDRIALAAPTGRAAQRLTDAVRTGLASLGSLPEECPDGALRELSATTLHQLLSYRPTRGTFGRHAENPIPADVVIVDEVSMVGVGLMAQLLQAVEPRAKLILLGDKDQLPSVEAGAVLAHLMPAGLRPSYRQQTIVQLSELFDDMPSVPHSPGPLQDVLVVLEENFRSQSEICAVARAVNDQQTDIVDSMRRCRPGLDPSSTAVSLEEARQRGGCWLLDQAADGNTRELQAVLDHWAKFHYLSSDGCLAYKELAGECELPGDLHPSGDVSKRVDQLFALLNRGRLLTLIREGPWGCVDINRYLAEAVQRHGVRGSRGGLFAGAPVLITRNDHNRQLFNGDVGLTLRSRAGGYRVVFQRQGTYLSVPADALPPHELGFALTVHKSQGSEYDQVLLVLPPTGGRKLLTKEIVYTGITRARHLAILCGPKEVVRTAIGRRILRESGLDLSE
jgi:exodeoxyribonuclease V alpha subunit